MRPWTKQVVLENKEVIQLPSLYIENMKLYHGSPVPTIEAFDVNEGDQWSTGKGIYLTPDKKAADGYARERGDRTPNQPTVYETEISNLDVADLRTQGAQESFAKLYRDALIEFRDNTLPYLKGPTPELAGMIKKTMTEKVQQLLEKIDKHDFRQLRELTVNFADLTTETLAKAGYHGLVSIEGEPPKIEFHDSYVIFDPKDIKITRQENIPHSGPAGVRF